MKKGFVLFIVIVNVIAVFATNTKALDYGIPQKTDDNIVVASYNIKWLGQSKHDLDKLAAVIKNFDVCGILEVKDEAEVLKLAKALKQKTGKDWGYVYGIRTHRPKGRYHEAYAVVWCRERVQLGDGVISNFWDMEEVYRNDPYIVSFKRKNFDFSLVLVHTRWSNDSEGNRESEVLMLAEHINWLRSFINEKDFILAGDFNYSGTKQVMKDMADDAGLIQIDSNAKSTFKKDNLGYSNPYDHIYISETDTEEFIPDQCAVLDVTKYIYGDNSPEHIKKSKKDLSDHLPVWAVFDVNQPDDD